MKKIKSLFAILAFGGLLLSGCDLFKKGNTPAEEPKGGTTVDGDTVLVDNTYEKFVVLGPNCIVSGEEDIDNGWWDDSSPLKDFNQMTAISLNQAKAIDATLGNTLATKNIKGLYKFEGYVLGTKDAGYTKEIIKDGNKVTVNGSYTFKACGLDKNEDEQWVKSCHFPSAECHGESLTPSTFWMTENMSAEKDANNFDHNTDPAALEAGVYTVVLATYKSAVGAMGIMCGVGLVKTASREGYVEPEICEVTSMDIAGSFEGWGTNPVVMTKAGNSFDATLVLESDADFKVRINGAWTYSLGAQALGDGAYHDNDGNISRGAGSYLVHVELGAAAIANFNLDHTIVAFTVSAVA